MDMLGNSMQQLIRLVEHTGGKLSNELLTRVVVQRNRLSDTNSVICRHCFFALIGLSHL